MFHINLKGIIIASMIVGGVASILLVKFFGWLIEHVSISLI